MKYKFSEAKYNDEYITVDEYIEEEHRGRLYCSECGIAPIHIVKRQKHKPYFASNRKDQHDHDCQHYAEFVEDKRLIHLLESDIPEDQERLRFLIDSNLAASIRLLNKEEVCAGSNVKIESNDVIDTSETTNSSIFIKESIKRVSIKNLKKREDLIGRAFIVYGQAELEVSYIDNPYNDKEKLKHLIFRRHLKLFSKT